jgi:hypothetical protein
VSAIHAIVVLREDVSYDEDSEIRRISRNDADPRDMRVPEPPNPTRRTRARRRARTVLPHPAMRATNNAKKGESILDALYGSPEATRTKPSISDVVYQRAGMHQGIIDALAHLDRNRALSIVMSWMSISRPQGGPIDHRRLTEIAPEAPANDDEIEAAATAAAGPNRTRRPNRIARKDARGTRRKRHDGNAQPA